MEATFEEFAFNLGSDTVKTDMALRHYGTLLGGHCSRHDWLDRVEAEIGLQGDGEIVIELLCQGWARCSKMIEESSWGKSFGKPLKGARASA